MKQHYNLSDSDYIKKLLPHEKNTLSIKEISNCIGKSPQFVRNAIKEGNLLAFPLQGRSLGKTQQRKSYFIPRDAVMSFLLDHGKTTIPNYIEQITHYIEKSSKEQLEFLQQIIEHKFHELDQLNDLQTRVSNRN